MQAESNNNQVGVDGPSQFNPTTLADINELAKHPKVVAYLPKVLMPRKVSMDSMRQLYSTILMEVKELSMIAQVDLLDNTTVVVRDPKRGYRMTNAKEREQKKPPAGFFEMVSSMNVVECKICADTYGCVGIFTFWCSRDLCDKEFYIILLENEPLFVDRCKDQSKSEILGYASSISEEMRKAVSEFETRYKRASAAARKFIGQMYQQVIMRAKILHVAERFHREVYLKAVQDRELDPQIMALIDAVRSFGRGGISGIEIVDPKEFICRYIRGKYINNPEDGEAAIRRIQYEPNDEIVMGEDNDFAKLFHNGEVCREVSQAMPVYDFSRAPREAAPLAIQPKRQSLEVAEILGSAYISIEQCHALIDQGATMNPTTGCLTYNGTDISKTKTMDFLKSPAAQTLRTQAAHAIADSFGFKPFQMAASNPVNPRAMSESQVVRDLATHINTSLTTLAPLISKNEHICALMGLMEYSDRFSEQRWKLDDNLERLLNVPILTDRDFIRDLIAVNAVLRFMDSAPGNVMKELYSAAVFKFKLSPQKIKEGLRTIGQKFRDVLSKERVLDPVNKIIRRLHVGLMCARILDHFKNRVYQPGITNTTVAMFLDKTPGSGQIDSKSFLEAAAFCGVPNMAFINPANAELLDIPGTEEYRHRLRINFISYLIRETTVFDFPPAYTGNDTLFLTDEKEYLLIASCYFPMERALIECCFNRLARAATIENYNPTYRPPLLTFLTTVLIAILCSPSMDKFILNCTHWIRDCVASKSGAKLQEAPDKCLARGNLMLTFIYLVSNCSTIPINTAAAFNYLIKELLAVQNGLIVVILGLCSQPSTFYTKGCLQACFVELCKRLRHYVQTIAGSGDAGVVIARTLEQFPPLAQLLAFLAGQDTRTPDLMKIRAVTVAEDQPLALELVLEDKSAPCMLTGKLVSADFIDVALATPGIREEVALCLREIQSGTLLSSKLPERLYL